MLYSRTENFLAFSGLYLKKATQDLRGDCTRVYGTRKTHPVRPLMLQLFLKTEHEKADVCMPLNHAVNQGLFDLGLTGPQGSRSLI